MSVFADVFKELEDRLLRRVEELVDNLHRPLREAQEMRWQELESKALALFEAEKERQRSTLDTELEALRAESAALRMELEGLKVPAERTAWRSAEREEPQRHDQPPHGLAPLAAAEAGPKQAIGATAAAAIAGPEALEPVKRPSDSGSQRSVPTASPAVAPTMAAGASPAASAAASLALPASVPSVSPPPPLLAAPAEGAAAAVALAAKPVASSVVAEPTEAQTPGAVVAVAPAEAVVGEAVLEQHRASFSSFTGDIPPELLVQRLKDRPSRQLLSLPLCSPPVPRTGLSRTMWVVLAVLMFLLLMVLLAFSLFPFVTATCIFITVMWMAYLCSEEQFIRIVHGKGTRNGRQVQWLMIASALRVVQGLRSSHENEHKIRAFMYAICAVALFFNPDVGVLTALYTRYDVFRGTAILTCIFFATTYAFHRLEQRMHERALRRGDHHPEDSPKGGNAVVQENLRSISQCLQERGRYQHRTSEKRIHELLARSDKAMLNEMLERMAHSGTLERTLGHFRDTAEHASRCQLLELLCVHRQEWLSVKSKVALLHTLMVMRLSSCTSAELAVESLLLGSLGDQLTAVKCMLDGNGSIHSMHKLVFEDVTDKDVKDRVLGHFLHEGTAQVAQRALMSSGHFRELVSLGRRFGCIPRHLTFFRDFERDGSFYDGRCGHSWLKIITDMDDTLQCSGGRWPAGIDARYPRHTTYPGVTAFYRELQGGGELGQLVALSARPHLVSDLVERGIFERFAKLMKQDGLHTMPALLTGEIDTGLKFSLSGGTGEGMMALGSKKFQKFQEYISLYPEFRVVFIGDNGQADYAVGQMMCEHYPHNVEQVWIHKVQPVDATWGYKPASKAPVAFFDDYVMAAVSAATRPSPLISPDGLERILTSAIEDFKKISTWPTPAHREAALSDLNLSISRACDALRAFGRDASGIEHIDGDRAVALAAPTAGADAAGPAQAGPDEGAGLSLFGRALSYAKGTRAIPSQAAESETVVGGTCLTPKDGFEVDTSPAPQLVERSPVAVDAAHVPVNDGSPNAVAKQEGVERTVSLVGRALRMVGGTAHSAVVTSLATSPQAAGRRSVDLDDGLLPAQLPPALADSHQVLFEDRGAAEGSSLATLAAAAVPPLPVPTELAAPPEITTAQSLGGLSLFNIARGLLPSSAAKSTSNSAEASQSVTPTLGPAAREAAKGIDPPTPPDAALPEAVPEEVEVAAASGAAPATSGQGAAELAAAAPSQFFSRLARALGDIRSTAPDGQEAKSEPSAVASPSTEAGDGQEPLACAVVGDASTVVAAAAATNGSASHVSVTEVATVTAVAAAASHGCAADRPAASPDASLREAELGGSMPTTQPEFRKKWFAQPVAAAKPQGKGAHHPPSLPAPPRSFFERVGAGLQGRHRSEVPVVAPAAPNSPTANVEACGAVAQASGGSAPPAEAAAADAPASPARSGSGAVGEAAASAAAAPSVEAAGDEALAQYSVPAAVSAENGGRRSLFGLSRSLGSRAAVAGQDRLPPEPRPATERGGCSPERLAGQAAVPVASAMSAAPQVVSVMEGTDVIAAGTASTQRMTDVDSTSVALDPEKLLRDLPGKETSATKATRQN